MRFSVAAALVIAGAGCELKEGDVPGSASGGGGAGAAANGGNTAGGGLSATGGSAAGGSAGACTPAMPPSCIEETTGYCGTFAARLRECGLLDEGCHGGCFNYGDLAEACQTECLSAAPCEAIIDFECAEGRSLLDCLGACIGEAPVACDDGTTLAYLYRCDGFEDCLTGEDELDCAEPTLKCRNVNERVPLSRECDGVFDCSDGTDELSDCFPEFVCDCTRALSSSLVCDRYPDCTDGSDEPLDCGFTVCPIAGNEL